jgi:hypothetical protein
MTKKMKQALDDHAAPDAMRASARQIWQASLGAFARAQEEGGQGGQSGRTLLARLAQDGAPAALPDDEVVPLAGAAARDRLEQVFEERVARALASIGVPSRAELAALREQVAQLSRQVAELSGTAGKTVKKVSAKKKDAPAGSRGKGGKTPA